MELSGALPTIFAKRLAIGVDLLEPEANQNNADDWVIDHDKLATFQQLSICGTFEDAMLVYHGIEMDERQLAALQLIYRTTNPWLMGHVTGLLLKSLESKLMNGRDKKEIAEILLQCVGYTPGEAKRGAENPEKVKGVLLKLAKEEDMKNDAARTSGANIAG